MCGSLTAKWVIITQFNGIAYVNSMTNGLLKQKVHMLAKSGMYFWTLLQLLSKCGPIWTNRPFLKKMNLDKKLTKLNMHNLLVYSSLQVNLPFSPKQVRLNLSQILHRLQLGDPKKYLTLRPASTHCNLYRFPAIASRGHCEVTRTF